LNWVVGNRAHCIKFLVDGAVPLYLGEGANPEIYRPLQLERTIDVCFVGRKSAGREDIINSVRQEGIAVEVFGKGWENGPLATSEQVNELFNRSKVVLGIGGLRGARISDLKGRDFEVPMSGSLYLTLYNRELEDFYRIGDEILCYQDSSDLIRQLRDVLTNPGRAEEIRRAGGERARRDHTWERRFEYLFRFAGVLKPPIADAESMWDLKSTTAS
jgi:hypothetical protein